MKIPGEVLKLLRFKPWPRKDWIWPTFQSHRGFWVEGARENSLSSLAAAKNKNYQMAEIDVRLSADNVPVLCHDKDLRRLAGVDLVTSKLTAAELKGWDFPSLQEILLTPERPPFINIEIKNDDSIDLQLERRVMEVLISTNKSHEVIISAFNPLSLKFFADHDSEVPRALLIEMDSVQRLSYWRLFGNIIAQAHMVNWPYPLLTKDLVEFLKSQNIPVGTWTVNDYRKANDLISWGVDTIITDRVLPHSDP